MRALRAALFLLLAVNTAYFGYSGAMSKFVDAAAWLALLALFQLELGYAERLRNTRARSLVRALRLVAAAGVLAAMGGYLFEENVLDAANTVLWIVLVVLLEIELRFARSVRRWRKLHRALLIAVYGGLAALVALWTARGMWLDAYDAVLWLAAFVVLELGIGRTTGISHTHVPAQR